MKNTTKQTMLLHISFPLFVYFTTLASPVVAAYDNFVYSGCSRVKYAPNSQYEINVNSILTSLVNSAMYTPFNNFTTGTPLSNDVVYGLYQCRADLTKPDCSACVQHALSQLGVICPDSCGGTLQLDGCLIKYDNVTFLGVEDKTVVVRKCGGPQLQGGYNSNELTQRDEVLSYMLTSGNSGLMYRRGESRGVKGVAQCVGDMSGTQCQDCLTEAIGRLKNECGVASWGDLFLAKCYVRYSYGGDRSHDGSSQDDEIEKTLAILVGLIAVAAFIIIFFAFLNKLCEGKGVNKASTIRPSPV